MATQQIRVEYDLALPNSFLVDHGTSDGNTRTSVYDGPDKIYLQIGADGREVAGPLTEDDIADGRPMPGDCVDWFEVDCATNPLICQLRGPVIDELAEDIQYGVYACGSRGGQVDTGRGSFQFAAQEAYLIENGEITTPLRDVSVSGLTLQILNDVDGLTKDAKLASPGFCGKGQTVPVGDGGPIMRIREALVG